MRAHSSFLCSRLRVFSFFLKRLHAGVACNFCSTNAHTVTALTFSRFSFCFNLFCKYYVCVRCARIAHCDGDAKYWIISQSHGYARLAQRLQVPRTKLLHRKYVFSVVACRRWSARRTPAFSQIVRQSHLIGKHFSFFFFLFISISILSGSCSRSYACVKSFNFHSLYIHLCALRGYFSSFLVDIVYRIVETNFNFLGISTRSLWVAHSLSVAWARYFPWKRWIQSDTIYYYIFFFVFRRQPRLVLCERTSTAASPVKQERKWKIK